MHLPVGQLKQVLTDFLSQEVLPKATGGAGLLLGVGAGMALRRMDTLLESYLPTLKTLGIVDDENRIDLEAIYEEATKTLASRGSVNIMGYLFDQADVEALLSIAKKYAV